ncbi:hypothetical protein SXCC_02345 [Gluconacetobacter sp. SXCC-1]|nr:hypothetical protein SXCC_02345 [Gluconacetobacter sp. SXCC-1]
MLGPRVHQAFDAGLVWLALWRDGRGHGFSSMAVERLCALNARGAQYVAC